MTVSGGVRAENWLFTWKKETFHTSDKKVDLHLEHNFWSHTETATDGQYLVSHVRVKNTGNVVLKDVKVYVDTDDRSPQFDAHICDANGQIIDQGATAPHINFGNLSPGVSSMRKCYWWIVKPRFPGAKGEHTHNVELRLYPVFTPDFKQSGQAFESHSRLDNA